MDYATEYEQGFNVLVDTIKMLKANCEHEVILVQGNHDRTKVFIWLTLWIYILKLMII